jgi:hypothetical protein
MPVTFADLNEGHRRNEMKAKKLIALTVLAALLASTMACGDGSTPDPREPEWTKTFGGPGFDYAYSVQQTFDGGFIVAGATVSFGAGGKDVYLIKTDASGNEQWFRTFGRPEYDLAKSVQQTSEGGFIVAGLTGSFGAGVDDVYLIKTDAWGNEQWTRIFGGSDSDRGCSVQQTSDGGFIVAGETSSFGAGKKDVWLIKVAPED